MTEAVPRIHLTDPQSKDRQLSLSSPVRPSISDGGTTAVDSGRRGSRAQVTKGTQDEKPKTSDRVSPGASRTTSASGAASQGSKPEVEHDEGPVVGNGAVQPHEAAIDPLSQQILKRTNAPNSTKPQKLPTSGDFSLGSGPAQASDSVADIPKRGVDGTGRGDAGTNTAKDKKKGVSFLSRFIGNKKKEPANEDESDLGDFRPEGMDAQLFSQPIDNMGFNPHHPQPPAYIRVKSRYKKEREFNRVFLAQELRTRGSPDPRKRTSNGASMGPSSASLSGNDPVWALDFSKDGKYLAAGGQDKAVRVWSVISTPEERRTHEKEEEAATGASEAGPMRLEAPVFQKKMFRVYMGHTATILDLSWSKNNFLLSSSMDKTVRLWHISRSECLCTFKHSDFVTSIQFHPRDDRFFLAGSLDAKLRLWSIPDKSVAFWNQMADMITAVAFTPDGKTAIAGTLGGLCQFYDTEGLKAQTQIHVRSNRGKNAKGSKITGIQAVNFPPDNPNGDVKLLISSNDSRVRLYNFRDKSLEVKYKGHENNFSQIRAVFSDDARHIICGSEDRKAYLWSTGPAEGDNTTGSGGGQRPVEMFEAHPSICTSAVLAPTKTRQLLSSSEDPLYDLCNPPPVTLVSMYNDEAAHDTSSISNHKPSTDEAEPKAHDHSASEGLNTANSSVQPTPNTAKGTFPRVSESPAYLARSTHPGGRIIVTADYTGCIKVFRQDCAYPKRRTTASDAWETGSNFSRNRVATGILGRTNSITTRASGSRRSLGGAAGGGDSAGIGRFSGRRRRDDSVSTQATQPPSDRILSWRQTIANSSGSFDAGSLKKKTRSVSPRKSVSQISVATSSSAAVNTRARNSLGAGSMPPPLPSQRQGGSSVATGDDRPMAAVDDDGAVSSHAPSGSSSPPKEPKPGPSEPTLSVQPPSSATSSSFLFWRSSPAPASPAAPPPQPRSNLPSPAADDRIKKLSVVSALSSEQSSVISEEGVAGRRSPLPGGSGAEADEEVRCRKCGGTAFSARLAKKGSAGTRLVCAKCGTPA